MFPEIRRNAHPDAAGCPLKHGKILTAIPRKALSTKGFQTALRISGSKRSSIRRRMPTEESKEPKGNKPEGSQPESRNPKHGWRETAEKRARARFRDCREADSDNRRIPSMWTCHKQSSTVMARHEAQYGLRFDASRICDRHKLSLTVATDPAPHCGRNSGCVLTGAFSDLQAGRGRREAGRTFVLPMGTKRAPVRHEAGWRRSGERKRGRYLKRARASASSRSSSACCRRRRTSGST